MIKTSEINEKNMNKVIADLNDNFKRDLLTDSFYQMKLGNSRKGKHVCKGYSSNNIRIVARKILKD